MQLSVQHDSYQGHRHSPWLVVVPRRISTTGRRQYRRFPTRAGASAFASQIKAHIRAYGEHPVDTITGDLATDARRAANLLEGSGLSLGQAAQLVARLLQQYGSVASILSYKKEGCGKAENTSPHPNISQTNTITLKDAITAMQNAKAHHAPSTVANRAQRFRTLLHRNPRLASAPLASLTPAQLEKALTRAWPTAPVAWNDCHKHLSALYNFAMRKGYCTATPMAAIDQRHDVQEAEIHPLHPAELRALFAACRPPTATECAAAAGLGAYERRCTLQDSTPLRPYIALCAFAGVRPAECARLRWQDISLEETVVSIRSRQSKTGGIRHIELHPTLAAWLAASRPPNTEEENSSPRPQI